MASTSVPSPPPAPVPRSRGNVWLVLGWILALPGLWVIASFLMLTPVSSWADCPAPLGVDFRPCPPGPLAGLADAMRQSVAITLILSFVGVGVLPPLYSGFFIAARIGRRVERWWLRRRGEEEGAVRTWRAVAIALVLFVGLTMVAGMVGRILADASSARLSLKELAEGMMGLAVMIGVVYGGYRLLRWGIRKWRGSPSPR